MSSKQYDLVIKGGRVMDPQSGLDAVRDVGIDGGSIGAIAESGLVGRASIDARGHVVAPGFIDMHHHNVGVPFGQKLALRDGVTSPLELEAGIYPVKTWYDALEGKCQTNFGASVGTIPVREHVFNPNYRTKFAGDFLYDMMSAGAETHTSMRWSTQVPTPDQIETIGRMLVEGLGEGSVGVGHCPGYMVAGCTQQESILAQKCAAEAGQAVFVHARFSSQMPPVSGILGFLEMMAPQELYGGGLVLQHMTAQALNDTPAALAFIDEARAKGLQVLPEIYPYNYGGTIVAADYLHPDNYQNNMARDYQDIIETSTMAPLTKERYEELVSDAPGTNVMFYNATEETVFAGLSHPTTVLGSDAFPYTLRADGSAAMAWDTPFDAVNGHPRGAGSHARLLRWTRERKVSISLMQTISKMSFMIADFLEQNGVPIMARKGRVQVGADADLVVFDPETVKDNATMQDGGLPSTGIPHVLVNGTPVVRDSEVLAGIFPGRAIHGSGKAA